MAGAQRLMEREQEGEDVCKRPAALTFLWIKHKVFSVLARRPHLLHPTCAAHIWNKLPRLLDMLMWVYFYEECWALTGGCLLLNCSCFKCPDDFEFFFLFGLFEAFLSKPSSFIMLNKNNLGVPGTNTKFPFRMITLYSKSEKWKSLI